MKRMVGALVLSFALLAPTGVMYAQDHAHHDWSQTEDPAWRRYLQEHHKKYHDYSKSKKKEQDSYWKWRDSHPDPH